MYTPSVTEAMNVIQANERASIDRDAAKIDELLTDDWNSINPVGDLVTKVELLERIVSGMIKPSSIQTEITRTQEYGHTVVVRTRYHVRMTIDGAPIDHRIWRTDIVVRTDDGRKIASTQATAVGKSKPN